MKRNFLKKFYLPTYPIFWACNPQCHTQTYFHTVKSVWVTKKWVQTLKISPILFNFNQFNNCPFFLGNYFLLYLVVWHRKAAKWSHNFFRSVCLVMRSPILLLKSWFQYMDPVCPKNLWVRHCYLQHIFLLNC